MRDKSGERKQVNIRKGERWTNERSEEGDEKGEAGRQGGRDKREAWEEEEYFKRFQNETQEASRKKQPQL